MGNMMFFNTTEDIPAKKQKQNKIVANYNSFTQHPYAYVQKYVLEPTIDDGVNDLCGHQGTALIHWVARSQDYPFKKLIDKHPYVDLTLKTGMSKCTPFCLAWVHNNREMARILMEKVRVDICPNHFVWTSLRTKTLWIPFIKQCRIPYLLHPNRLDGIWIGGNLVKSQWLRIYDRVFTILLFVHQNQLPIELIRLLRTFF